MSLLTFGEARPWAKAIKKEVESLRMPPWGAEAKRGVFANDPTLTNEEIALIVQWVEAGAPEGNRADLPAPRIFNTGWTIGEPELLLVSPRVQQVPAEGNDLWVDIELDPQLTEDKWIAGIEVRPSDRSVLHHAMAYALQEKDADLDWSQIVGRSANFLAEYGAGNNGDIYPAGTGRRIRAGAKILVQAHYHPNGRPAQDQLTLGLRFHPEGSVSRAILTKPISNFDLHIPAGEPNFFHQATFRIERPSRLISFQPHMHYRGKSMKLEAIHPDGQSESLCSVPRYDPNWQITYIFKTPPLVERGTRLKITGIFDNSPQNPLNPNPNVDVLWGPLAVDEMMIGWLDYYFADNEG